MVKPVGGDGMHPLEGRLGMRRPSNYQYKNRRNENNGRK
jgi:hypothetical protein